MSSLVGVVWILTAALVWKALKDHDVSRLTLALMVKVGRGTHHWVSATKVTQGQPRSFSGNQCHKVIQSHSFPPRSHEVNQGHSVSSRLHKVVQGHSVPPRSHKSGDDNVTWFWTYLILRSSEWQPRQHQGGLSSSWAAWRLPSTAGKPRFRWSKTCSWWPRQTRSIACRKTQRWRMASTRYLH